MFYIIEGGQLYPVPPCLLQWLRHVPYTVMSVQPASCWHRLELPVLRYHIQGKLPLHPLEGIFWVFLHDFIR